MLDFSSSPVPSSFSYPKNIKPSPSVGLDIGPDILNTPQDVLPTKLWNVRLDNNDAIISSSEDPDVVLFSDTNIVHIDLTFDTSGNPFVCYEKEAQILLYWFDPILASITTTILTPGTQPSCFLNLRFETPQAQIILAYNKFGAIKYRLGVDRFTVEYDAGMNDIDNFEGAYLGTNNRIVFKGTREEFS